MWTRRCETHLNHRLVYMSLQREGKHLETGASEMIATDKSRYERVVDERAMNANFAILKLI